MTQYYFLLEQHVCRKSIKSLTEFLNFFYINFLEIFFSNNFLYKFFRTIFQNFFSNNFYIIFKIQYFHFTIGM